MHNAHSRCVLRIESNENGEKKNNKTLHKTRKIRIVVINWSRLSAAYITAFVWSFCVYWWVTRTKLKLKHYFIFVCFMHSTIFRSNRKRTKQKTVVMIVSTNHRHNVQMLCQNSFFLFSSSTLLFNVTHIYVLSALNIQIQDGKKINIVP